MKKILTLIFFLGTVAFLNAQTTVKLHGELLVVEGAPAAERVVYVAFVGDTIDNEAFYQEHQAITDNSGFYGQEFVLPDFVTSGYFYASVTNCHGENVSGWLTYEPSKTDYTINLKYCSDQNTDPVDTIYNISGYVMGDSAMSATYRVYLYHEKGYWIDSVDTEGFYNFENPLPGGYVIHAMVTPGQDNPRPYVPTYYGQTTDWAAAKRVYTPATDTHFYNIYLLSGEDVSGNGDVGGKLTQNGFPVANASILLFDGNGDNVLNCTTTDGEGIYSFKMREGNYSIRVEMFGYISEFNTVAITPQNMQSLNENFAITNKTIHAQDATGINRLNSPKGSVVLFPNPVQDRVHIEIAATENDVTTLEIFNVSGARVAERTVVLSSGKNSVEIPAAELTKGFYTVRISGASIFNTVTFVK